MKGKMKVEVDNSIIITENQHPTMAGAAQLFEHQPVNLKVAGLILSWSEHMPGF